MKKVLKKFNRTLSIMLAAAMVLTMVPQTAMPVLAAETQDVTDPSETPDTTPATDENEGSADVVETGETPENPPLDEPGGNDEGDVLDPSGDNETPVIDPVENPDEDPADDPSGEEVVAPTTDPDVTIMGDVTPQADLAAPVITLKKGDETIDSGTEVPNGTSNVKFELKAAEGTEGTPEFYYNIDQDAAPTKDSTKYAGSAVEVTAPSDTTAKTVTIKAIAYIAATGTEGEEGYKAEQTSAVATATVVFKEKAKTVSLSEESDTATVTIGGKDISTEEYAIPASPKDTEVVVSADGKMFEVMYRVNGDTWTSALKKGMAANKPYKDRAVSYGTGTYVIPRAELLKGSVEIKASYLKEITFDWQGDAGWDSVGVSSGVLRVDSDSTDNVGIWGWTTNYPDITDGKEDVLFAPQDTKVELSIYPLDGVDFTFTTVNYKKTGSSDMASDATVSDDKKSATLTIANIESNDYTVTVDGTSATYSRTSIKDANGDYVPLNRNAAGTIQPREAYTIQAFMTGGKTTYPIDSIEVTIGSADAADQVELTKDEAQDSTDTEKKYTGTYTLKAKKEAAGKILKVKVKDKDTILANFTLTVAPVISKVTVAKATGSNKDIITQTIGTSVDYVVTPVDKKSADELGVKVTENAKNALKEDAVALAKKADGTYILTVATTVETPSEGAAKIAIYNKNDQTEDAADITPLTTLTVNTTGPAWGVDKDNKGGAAPTVKSVSANDIAISLDMTLPNSASDKVEGAKYYYKVETTAVDKTKSDYTANGKARYYEAATNGKTTRASIQVIDKDFGKGRSEKFTAKVELVLYKDSDGNDSEDTTVPAGTLIATSKPVTLNNLATQAVYFADKITLKKEKAASGIYTGQTAEVASVDFGKNATYNRDQDVAVWVKEYQDAQGSADAIISVKTTKKEIGGKETDLTVNGGKVTLVVGKDVKPGKYTLCAAQTSGTGILDDTIQATATMQFTVVQGIKTIEASSAKTIYVSDKKAGTAKIAAVYNDGNPDKKPKAAKVTYQIGKVNEQNKFEPVEAYEKFVTVKNGTVTVVKGYKTGIEENKFAVNVKAADFEENIAADYVEYEIVTKAQELGNIVLVTKDQEGKFTPVTPIKDSKNKEVLSVTADQAANTYIRILSGTTEKTKYEEADFVDPGLYTLTFSKKNDVGVNADQALVVKKVVTDVTVKALTTDGGNVKAANDGKLKFSIGYENVTNAKLQIATDSNYADFGTSNTTAITTPTGAPIKVKAVGTLGEASIDLSKRLVDYKVTVDGGATIVENNGDKDNLDITLVMKKNKAVLTLKNQKNVKVADYTITNANFDAKKAPKISLSKGQTLYAKYAHEQTIKFTVDKWVPKNNGDKSVVKKIKVTAAPDDTSKKLYDLIKDKTITVNNDTLSESAKTEIAVTFNSTENTDVIKNGILRFDLVDENDKVVTQTSADVKITTALLKKSYKLTNKYSMSEQDAAKVTLTGKSVGVAKKQGSDALDVTFEKILNANIKGEVNHFREAFELDTANSQLKLLEPSKAITNDGASGKYKGVNNLIGFVVYTVKYEDGTSEKFTTQLTIAIDKKKPAINGLKTTAQPVLAAADMAPEFAVINSKKAPVKLVAAAFEGAKGGEIFEIDAAKAGGYDKGIVILKLKADTAVPSTYKKLDGTLTVLPEDSYYAEQYTDASDPNAKAKILTEHGIGIAVKIDVKDPAKTKNLVKLDSKQSKVDFKDVTETSGTYTFKAPYTVNTSATVEKIERDETVKNNKPVSPEWITFAEVEGENAVNITIDKAKYAKAVKDGGKDNKGNYKLNGKAVDATAVVSYKAAGSQKDSLKYKITPPVLEASVIEGAVDPTPDAETFTVTVSPATAEVEKGGNQTFTVTVTGSKNGEVSNPTVAWSVAAASDGGTMTANTSITTDGKLTVDANETAAKLTVTATYTKDSKTYTGTATVTVKDAAQQGG